MFDNVPTWLLLIFDVAGVDPLGVGGQGQQGRNPRPNSNSGSNNNQGQLRSSCCCSRTTLGCPNPRNQDNLVRLMLMRHLTRFTTCFFFLYVGRLD